MKRLRDLLIAIVSMAMSSSVRAQELQDVTFGFEVEGVPCGGEFLGAPGDDLNLYVRMFIETDRAGVVSWSSSIAAEGPGLRIFLMTNAEADPCEKRCDYPCDGPCRSQFIFGPGTDPEPVFFLYHASADPLGDAVDGPLAEKGPQGPGYVDTVVLRPSIDGVPEVRLPPGRVPVLRMPIGVTIPEDPGGAELRFMFRDGMTHEDNYLAAYNTVQISGDPFGKVNLHLTECSITIRPRFPRMLPGDADASGALDISDPLAILMNLFVFEVEELPCGNADASHPANRALLDFSGDGVLDITDPIVALRHLFLGDPPHALGKECRIFPECPDACALEP